VTYKLKTVQNVLSEIAGLLIISRVLALFLHSFNEWKFNKKIKKETNEEFRDVFTYPNFKKTMVENQDIKTEIYQIKEKNIELQRKVDQLMQLQQRMEDLERLVG
jgi:hypothetical protein